MLWMCCRAPLWSGWPATFCFWAYRLDNVFLVDMYNALTMMTNAAFDPRTGISETMHRQCKNKHVNHKFDYKVVNMNKHLCTCEDR